MPVAAICRVLCSPLGDLVCIARTQHQGCAQHNRPLLARLLLELAASIAELAFGIFLLVHNAIWLQDSDGKQVVTDIAAIRTRIADHGSAYGAWDIDRPL